MELDVVVDVVAMEAQHHSRIISIPSSALPAGQATNVWQVPASTRWRIRSLFVVLTTGIVVANRNTAVNWFDQAGNQVGGISTGFTQVASQQVGYTFAYGGPLATGFRVNVASTPIPLIELPEGWSINFAAQNMDVADTLTSAILVVDAIPSRRVPTIDAGTFENI